MLSRPVRRFVIDTGRPFDQFRKQFERAVPSWSWGTAVAEAKGGGGWRAIEKMSDRTAVNGLVTIATLDPSGVMRLAGHHLRAVTYLASNLVLTEQLYKLDPAAIEYLPLRLTISELSVDDSTLTFDKPCDLFAGYAVPELVKSGRDVEQAMSSVLRAVDLPVPPELDAD
jgi:hypothetical protein